jgi:hypothetical protein
MRERFGYPALTAEVKQKIFWKNGAQLYGFTDAELRNARSPVDPEELRLMRASLS